MFHYREDRIRAHVQLCWLALLLIRVVENTAADTWRNVRHELDRMHLVTLATPHGKVAQRSSIPQAGRRAHPDHGSGQELHLITDNCSAHKRVEVRDWLAAHPGSGCTRTPW